MKHHALLLGSTVLGLLVYSTSPLAQMTALCNGCSTRIDAHGVCRDIYNGAGAAIMIPWNSPGEWASFYNNGHGGVSVTPCPPPQVYKWWGMGYYSEVIASDTEGKINPLPVCAGGTWHGTPCATLDTYCMGPAGPTNIAYGIYWCTIF